MIKTEADDDFEAINATMEKLEQQKPNKLKRKAEADLKDQKGSTSVPRVSEVAASASASAAAAATTTTEKKMISLEGKEVLFSEEQKRGAMIAASGANMLLTGSGGTGKTTLTRYIKQQAIDKGKVVVSTALTALAGTIVEGAATFNSTFGIDICKEDEAHYAESGKESATQYLVVRSRIEERKALCLAMKSTGPERAAALRAIDFQLAELAKWSIHKLATADIIFVDEVGLLRISVLRKAMAKLRACLAVFKKPMPQFIFLGDPLQAKPVNPVPDVKRATEREVEEYQEDCGFLLDSEIWKSLNIQRVDLLVGFRQEDKHQIELLDHVRAGVLKPEHELFLQSINKRTSDIELQDLNDAKIGKMPPIHVAATRDAVHQRNTKMLNQIKDQKPVDYVSHVYYVEVDREIDESGFPKEGGVDTFWHCKFAFGLTGLQRKEGMDVDFRFEYGDPLVDVAPAVASDGDVEQKAWMLRPLSEGDRNNIIRETRNAFKNLQIEPVFTTKKTAAVLVTRSVIPGLVVNGTRGMIADTANFESFAAKNVPPPPSRKVTQYIKMYRGLPPSESGEGTPRIRIRVPSVPNDTVEVAPAIYEFPTQWNERSLKRTEWTSFICVYAFPCLRGYSVTIHKSIGMTFDDMLLDAKSIKRHGDKTGLFYLGLSRARDLYKVALVDYDHSVIAARVCAIRHYRKTLPVFKDLSDDEFEEWIETYSFGMEDDPSFFRLLGE